jgi:hypothetical protein
MTVSFQVVIMNSVSDGKVPSEMTQYTLKTYYVKKFQGLRRGA